MEYKTRFNIGDKVWVLVNEEERVECPECGHWDFVTEKTLSYRKAEIYGITIIQQYSWIHPKVTYMVKSDGEGTEVFGNANVKATEEEAKLACVEFNSLRTDQ